MSEARDGYRYSLSVSSQFPFCGLPLRMDTYSACQFACRYCFASARGGAVSKTELRQASASDLERRLIRVNKGIVKNAIDEMLSRSIPIHLGGMSDPFPPLESSSRTTERVLRIARSFDYPVVMSTKSILVGSAEIIRILRAGRFAVQVSLSTLDDKLGMQIDAGAPLPSLRLQLMKKLVDAGVPVSCRIQPVLPGREHEVPEIIGRCAEAGVKHVGVEHLKVPIEHQWVHRRRMEMALGVDVVEVYKNLGARRSGREWILPVAIRLGRMIGYREEAKRQGMSFGAADNDLLHFSDGRVCCSGADLLGVGDGFRFNFLEAVRNRSSKGEITISSIESAWRPRGSIAMYVNSRTRIPSGGMDAYIKKWWNGSENGFSVSQFYGVADSGGVDGDGFKIYRLAEAPFKGIGGGGDV